MNDWLFGWIRGIKGGGGSGHQGHRGMPGSHGGSLPAGVTAQVYGETDPDGNIMDGEVVYDIPLGSKVPKEIRESNSILMRESDGNMITARVSFSQIATHSDLANLKEWDAQRFDESTRIFGGPIHGLLVHTTGIGWPRGKIPGDDHKADAGASKKLGPLAKGLIAAGYPSYTKLEWSTKAPGRALFFTLGELAGEEKSVVKAYLNLHPKAEKAWKP